MAHWDRPRRQFIGEQQALLQRLPVVETGRAAATCGIIATVVALGACSSASPPPSAGTLVVHAVFHAGPAAPSGIQKAMPNAEVRVIGHGVDLAVTSTDNFGNARFRLSPGRYLVQLISADGCTAGTYDSTVTLRPHEVVRARVTCGNP